MMLRFGKLPLCTIAAMLWFSGTPAWSSDLLDVHQQALENDPVVRAAQAARNAEFEARPQSRALLFPVVEFNADYTEGRERILASPFLAPADAGDTTDFDSNGISLSLIQPLYNRASFVQQDQSDATLARADAEYQAALQNLVVRVAQVYFDLLAARDDLRFARAEKNAIERQLDQAKQRFDVGLVAITDVHEAQAAFDLATATEIEAINQVQSSEEALYEISGGIPDRIEPLMEEIPLQSPNPEDIEQWVDTAMERNFSLLAARYSEEVAEDAVSLQRAGHHPRLDLVASISRTESTSSSLGGRQEVEEGRVGLQFTLPLYEGGAVVSQTREAAFLLTEAQQEVERQRRATVRQTRDAYLAVTAAINRVKALAQARVSAQSALEATEAGFEVGTRTTVDVLLARSDLYEAEREFARARYDYIINTLLLKQASGTLTIGDLQEFNRWLES